MRQGSWHAAVAAIFVCAWGGNQFTPLLVMYRDTGFSPLVVNTLLGAYVLGLVPGLLLAGGLAARFGRRPVVLAGVLASLLASLLLAAVVVSMSVMPVGLLAGVAAAIVRAPLVALAAALSLGCAYGMALVSGLLELQRLARPEELAALTGVYYALAYLGFLLPSLLSLLSAVAGYPVLLGGLVVAALAGAASIVRHSRSFLPAGAVDRGFVVTAQGSGYPFGDRQPRSPVR